METVTELYTPDALSRVHRANRIRLAALAALALAVLTLCAAMLLRATPLTAAAAEKRVVCISTLGGWAVIALWLELVLPWRREERHMAHMLSGARECAEGELSLTGETVAVPKSAPMRRCALRSGEHVRNLTVSPRRVKALGTLPGRRRVWTVYGCIVAWEALE